MRLLSVVMRLLLSVVICGAFVPTTPLRKGNVLLHAKQSSSKYQLINSLKQARTAREVAATLSQIGEINDPKLLTIAMSSYRRVRHPNRALALFYDARRRGIELDLILYSAAISACERGGLWKRALQLLDEMQHRGIEPNVISFSAAISACEKGEQWERGLQLLNVRSQCREIFSDWVQACVHGFFRQCVYWANYLL